MALPNVWTRGPLKSPLRLVTVFVLTGFAVISFLNSRKPLQESEISSIDETRDNEVVEKSKSSRDKPRSRSFQELIDYIEWTNCGACKTYFEFGGKIMKNNAMPGIDGQKAICMDTGLYPEPGNCTIYSMGVGYNWSFDEVMEEYGCDIFAFDPTVPNPFKKSSTRIKFFDIGIASNDLGTNDKGWKMESLSTIRRRLGHSDKVIDYFKMDIEGGEWDLLRSFIGTGQLDKVRQLSIEVHLTDKPDKLWDHMKTLQELEESGFVRFFSRENVWNRFTLPGNVKGAACYEIAWFNKNFTLKK